MKQNYTYKGNCWFDAPWTAKLTKLRWRPPTARSLVCGFRIMKKFNPIYIRMLGGVWSATSSINTMRPNGQTDLARAAMISVGFRIIKKRL